MFDTLWLYVATGFVLLLVLVGSAVLMLLLKLLWKAWRDV